jgi:hypothetical protein
MDGTTLETQIEERRRECLLMSSTEVQKLMCKTRRKRRRNAEYYVMKVTPTTNQPTEFHTREGLSAEQCEHFRSFLYNNFPKLMQPVNSPHVSRQLDHPIETTRPMKRQRLNILLHAERAELNRQLKDAMEVGMTRPSHSEFGSPILFVRIKLMAVYACALTTVDL